MHQRTRVLKYADVEIQALEMFNIARLLSDKINMLERSQNVGQCFKSRHFDHGLHAVRALVPYTLSPSVHVLYISYPCFIQ